LRLPRDRKNSPHAQAEDARKRHPAPTPRQNLRHGATRLLHLPRRTIGSFFYDHQYLAYSRCRQESRHGEVKIGKIGKIGKVDSYSDVESPVIGSACAIRPPPIDYAILVLNQFLTH
jgi:hypothetical protein